MTETSSFLKFSSPLTIQYIVISNTPNYTDSEFYVNSFNLLRTLPIDLMQLENSIQHFEFSFKYKAIKSYELFTLPGDVFNLEKEVVLKNIDNYSKSFGVQSLIKVFIIDSTLKNHAAIAKTLELMEYSYYVIIGEKTDNTEEYLRINLFNNTTEFIEIINRDIGKIKSKLDSFYEGTDVLTGMDFQLQINPKRTFIRENNIPGAILTWNNYFVLNQIIGNYWLEVNSEIGTTVTLPEERTKEIVNQCQKIDSIYAILYNDVGVKPTDPFQPIFPTLILIQPYHYPKTENLLDKRFSKQQKQFSAVLNSEQDLMYQHLIPEQGKNAVSEDGIKLIMSKNLKRLMYLDNVAYLHSMFTYSPVMRLPQIGKSINLELSHLEKITPKKESTISNIEKFGKKISNLTLDQISKNYIKERNGQIFAISDLPLEWLYLDEHPLCFTHDVCRLPEFNLNSIVNNAVHLQRKLFQIPNDLINNTLVVHCASKDDAIMNRMFELIDSHKEKLGFSSVKCSTITEISEAIKKHKPELLIFDCHGASNKKDLSTYLIVDNEKNEVLTGNDIIKYEISAPLVFLSACETFPNYGYVKLLSDAFMQAGAYCVTTTFLPIKIIDAATVIIRLLNNLHQLKSNSYHINWLNFLSHILRSSLIFETINKSRDYLKEEITNDEIATIVTKSMRFENRIEALNDLNSLIEKKSKKQIKFSQLDNEWLSYSIIGRADLIYFENWLKSYRDINMQ
ncbi:CHAT domain-containing protein [Flavobacterium terrae]|uniref:CHAT domain-containing protein n=1 Tax=Flavobacterium terrae TaxID=415425 RepID=A0A1M6DGI9_9FLAO|nr:CHAT domain-containing protein [Flavobacterium terrae]SHI72261.1 CHAT domain-containing protein [Flavobacterium terrae]